ncbi:tyrosine-type recombinase/integrase [Tautonia rosea]|uniref:tyrosine-type recombinase/integrase n=1 Tax=Tautonia rosea TaxID=2728037 RepID=UPI0014746044|nr:tyrosine-type recombinase/integrase [Tautonia rosea]
MASIFKPSGRKKYVILYFDENGRRRKVIGATDKTVTERIARDLENRVLLRKEGVIDARDEARRDHEARPLVDHLADFRAHLTAKGNTSKHADLTWPRAARLLALSMGAKLADIEAPNAARKARALADERLARHLESARLSDISADRVQAALAVLRTEGRSTETINAHLRAAKGFSRWLWKVARRIRDDALAPLSLMSAESDRRHERRALSEAEAVALIQAAERGGLVGGMTGRDRAMLYRVALGTGFRAGELRSLTPEGFRLDSDPPVIVCEAAYAKNRRKAEQPITNALAAILRPWIASRPPGRPVFDTMPKLKTAAMLRADLAEAGIDYRDASGRVADFHSLRATYITAIVRGGASVKTAQTLARHASPVLTIGRYAHVAIHDQTAALDALPDLTTPPRTEAAQATGTDGRPVETATQNATHEEVSVHNSHTLQLVASSCERIANPLFPGSNPGGASL